MMSAGSVPWRQSVMLLAHTQPAALVALVITGIARDVFGGPVLVMVHGGAVAVTALTFGAELYHEYRLCPGCGANTPLDGQAMVRQRQRWLRLHHWATERWGYTVFFVAAPVAYLSLGLPSSGAVYPVFALWALVAYASLRHRPLVPWCPQCRHWGWGDDGDDDPDPVPPRDDTATAGSPS